MVSCSHTIIYPWTVMIILLHTSLAYLTMSRSRWFYNITVRTNHMRLIISQKNDQVFHIILFARYLLINIPRIHQPNNKEKKITTSDHKKEKHIKNYLLFNILELKSKMYNYSQCK